MCRTAHVCDPVLRVFSSWVRCHAVAVGADEHALVGVVDETLLTRCAMTLCMSQAVCMGVSGWCTPDHTTTLELSRRSVVAPQIHQVVPGEDGARQRAQTAPWLRGTLAHRSRSLTPPPTSWSDSVALDVYVSFLNLRTRPRTDSACCPSVKDPGTRPPCLSVERT